MINRDDAVFIELLGKDRPEVQALLAAANVPGMEGAVHEMIKAMVIQRGWDPNDPPKFAPPEDISPSGYLIGTAMCGDVAGLEVGLAKEDLPSHIGVFGITGTGKTMLIKLLLAEFIAANEANSFFVWDAHGEYADLLSIVRPGSAVWLDADELGLNPFEVPADADGRPVMTADKWLNHLREWLRLCWLNEPSLNLLCEILRDEYQKRGLLDVG
jgi:hypothetical protein